MIQMMNFKEWLRISEDIIAGNAPPQKQLHVFDFDDTLGVTQNANGIMVYQNGQPMHKTLDDAKNWASTMGLGTNDLLDGPHKQKIEFVKERNGYVIYVSSSGLAKVQSHYDRNKQFVTGVNEPRGDGEEILIDFTPSSFVDQSKTHPIEPSITKLADQKNKGSETIVMTARKTNDVGTSIKGQPVQPTNAQDIKQFLNKHGVNPDAVIGVTGQNKGNQILKYIKQTSPTEPPEEIHFYDDLKKNTDEVESAIANKTPSELHIYGPGEFESGQANPNVPKKSFDKKPSLNNKIVQPNIANQ